jgi:hypothetical protein
MENPQIENQPSIFDVDTESADFKSRSKKLKALVEFAELEARLNKAVAESAFAAHSLQQLRAEQMKGMAAAKTAEMPQMEVVKS